MKALSRELNRWALMLKPMLISTQLALLHLWTMTGGQIYLYVATKTYRRWGKNEMPTDIAVESISDYQMQELNRLKEWLYRKRTQARLDRQRTERRQKREEESAKRKAEQPVLFEF